jgi:2-(1,2-epoxy-1,2-dihydrophenyl)acetyl-CoA isomerase
MHCQIGVPASVTVSFVQRESTAWITISNPETRNALTTEDRRELATMLYAADSDPVTAAIVLTGSNGHFCSGGDIREFEQIRTTAEASRYATDVAQAVFVALRQMHTPTIARVEGVAAGAGMYLALGCDIVVAENGARFVPAHLQLGVPPDWGAIWLLPRLVGLARAKRHLLTGRPISAVQAAEWGLIADAVAAESLDPTVIAYCADIARFAAPVVATTRRGLDRSFDSALSVFLEWEAQAIAAAIQTPEHLQRVREFLARRTEVAE